MLISSHQNVHCKLASTQYSKTCLVEDLSCSTEACSPSHGIPDTQRFLGVAQRSCSLLGIPYSQPSLVVKTIPPLQREAWDPVLINISHASNIRTQKVLHFKGQIASVPLKTLENVTHFYLIFLPSPEPADAQFLLGRRVRTSYNVCSSWLGSCLHPGGPELLLTAALCVLQSSLPWVILQTPVEATTTVWAKLIHRHTSSGYLEVLFWDLLVCRGFNENACTASVLKSTGCISTGNFYMCTHMYVHGYRHMWMYRNIKLTASNS